MRSRAASGLGTSFCAPMTKMTLAAPHVGGELAAGGRGDDECSVAGDCVDAAEGVVGLAGDRLHLWQLRREVERHQLVAHLDEVPDRLRM
jgi:hypothetical protein